SRPGGYGPSEGAEEADREGNQGRSKRTRDVDIGRRRLEEYREGTIGGSDRGAESKAQHAEVRQHRPALLRSNRPRTRVGSLALEPDDGRRGAGQARCVRYSAW